MSDQAQTPPTAEPAQAPESSQPAERGVPQARPDAMPVGREVDRTQAALDALQRIRSGASNGADSTEDEAPAEASSEAEAEQGEVTEQTETAPPPPDQPKPDESADFKARLDRLNKANLDAEKRLREFEQQLRAERERAERYEKLKSNPLDLLKDAGYSFEDLVRKAAKGEIRPSTEHDIAIEKTTTEVDALRQQLEELRGSLQTREQAETEQREIAAITERVKERAESAPAASVLDWVPNQARQEFYRLRSEGHEVELDQVVDQINGAILGDAKKLMSDERSLKTLLADSEVRKAVQAALGHKQSARTPASTSGDRAADGPRSISRETAAEPGKREVGVPLTEDERRAAAMNALRRVRSA